MQRHPVTAPALHRAPSDCHVGRLRPRRHGCVTVSVCAALATPSDRCPETLRRAALATRHRSRADLATWWPAQPASPTAERSVRSPAARATSTMSARGRAWAHLSGTWPSGEVMEENRLLARIYR